MFTYCNNMPVNNKDNQGSRPMEAMSLAEETPEERAASVSTTKAEAQRRIVANSYTVSYQFDQSTGMTIGTYDFNSSQKAREVVQSFYPIFRTTEVDYFMTRFGDYLPNYLQVFKKPLPKDYDMAMNLLNGGLSLNDFLRSKERELVYSQIEELGDPHIRLTIVIWDNGDLFCTISNWK